MAISSALLCIPLPLRRPPEHRRATTAALSADGVGNSLALGARCSCTCGVPSLPAAAGCAWQQNSLLDLRFKSSGRRLKFENARSASGASAVPMAGMRLDPGGGGSNDGKNGVGRVVFNLALAGGLTYLTLTGKLGWVFDTIISLWLLAFLLPVVGLVAFLWFAEREIITGACPNCGQSFQVFEFAVKEEPQFCPYCSQPFKLENKQFVRDEPRFSGQKSSGFKPPFGGTFGGGGFGKAKRPDEETGGVIVDVEAEVMDRD